MIQPDQITTVSKAAPDPARAEGTAGDPASDRDEEAAIPLDRDCLFMATSLRDATVWFHAVAQVLAK
jgi:hypothetical protein